jgi:hypothetical protein
VANDQRQIRRRKIAPENMRVCAADAAARHFDENFSGLGVGASNFFAAELVLFVEYGGAHCGKHGMILS